MKEIEKKVNGFKTKYIEGFLKEEVDILLKDFSKINMDKFNDSLSGVTCIVIENQSLMYHHDIKMALICGIENRSLRYEEWD